MRKREFTLKVMIFLQMPHSWSIKYCGRDQIDHNTAICWTQRDENSNDLVPVKEEKKGNRIFDGKEWKSQRTQCRMKNKSIRMLNKTHATHVKWKVTKIGVDQSVAEQSVRPSTPWCARILLCTDKAIIWIKREWWSDGEFLVLPPASPSTLLLLFCGWKASGTMATVHWNSITFVHSQSTFGY